MSEAIEGQDNVDLFFSALLSQISFAHSAAKDGRLNRSISFLLTAQYMLSDVTDVPVQTYLEALEDILDEVAVQHESEDETPSVIAEDLVYAALLLDEAEDSDDEEDIDNSEESKEA